jgi:hypothetical protein
VPLVVRAIEPVFVTWLSPSKLSERRTDIAVDLIE